MPRQFFTAADIIQLARLRSSDVLVLSPEDIVTQEAEEVAQTLGIRLVREKEDNGPSEPMNLINSDNRNMEKLAALKKVGGFGIILDPFGDSAAATAANVRLKDVISSADHSPMAAGYMTLEAGEFPWLLSYDEIDIILEGELVITRGSESVRGGAGDVIFIPKGSDITFGTPNKVRFVYVTFPADWNEKQ